jgi:transcriptional regulator GlxA family with amidase domain
MNSTTTRTGILVFDDVEVLDFCGPYEVFATTRLNESRRREDSSPFEPLLVAERPEPVIASGGMRVLPDHKLDDCPPLDVLLVPGGWGVRRELSNRRLLGWISARAKEAGTPASVCTGAMLLGEAGLLDERRATIHWRSLDWMQDSFPSVEVGRELRVVDEGDIVTSAGISAGIDLALTLVARHCGEEVARSTARHMEYL